MTKVVFVLVFLALALSVNLQTGLPQTNNPSMKRLVVMEAQFEIFSHEAESLRGLKLIGVSVFNLPAEAVQDGLTEGS